MEKKYFKDVLEGEHIKLEKLDPSHAQQIFSLMESNRERLREFLPWVDQTKTSQDTENYIKQTHQAWDEKTMFDYGIYLKENNLYIGSMGLILSTGKIDGVKLVIGFIKDSKAKV